MRKTSILFHYLLFISQALILVSSLFLISPEIVHAENGDFVWAKSMGGDSVDRGYSIFVDSSGNVYTTGYFQGIIDFDPGPGTFYLSSKGSKDIFISKLGSNGNFVWAKSIGGAYEDIGYGISVDTSGNVYTTGSFYDTVDFDPGPGTFYLASTGGSDKFISKLDSNGNFVWAKSMGGGSDSYGLGISVDTSGNVFTTGYFWGSIDLDPGTGTYNLSSKGSFDIFVSKLDSDGSFIWAKAIGGTSDEMGLNILVDTFDNVYTTGYFRGTVDFDPGLMTFNLISKGYYADSHDIFVSKMDNNGNFISAKAIGDASEDIGYGISVDTSGNVYTTGSFSGTADFDPGPETFHLTSRGSTDIFIGKMTKLTKRNKLIWPTIMLLTTNN